MTNGARPEGIVGLARQLVREIIDLAKIELTSARQELGEGLQRLGRGAAFIGIALALVLLAIVGLVVLVIALIALFLPLWLSALIVIVVFLLLAALFGWLGIRRLNAARDRLALPETRTSVQEDIAWARRLLRRDEK